MSIKNLPFYQTYAIIHSESIKAFLDELKNAVFHELRASTHEFSLRSMNCKTLSCVVAYICTIMHCKAMQFITALPLIHVCIANNSCPQSGQFIINFEHIRILS